MDNFVITIARQYGSGGRTVGEMLAKKLGIGYYDKDIIRMASEDSGIHETLFGRIIQMCFVYLSTLIGISEWKRLLRS